MNELRFEWDAAKAASNLSKHKVGFEEARSVFYDDHALLIAGTEHSLSEERFILLGVSAGLKFLVVGHCERQGGNGIRILSAGKADAAERAAYLRRLRL